MLFKVTLDIDIDRLAEKLSPWDGPLFSEDGWHGWSKELEEAVYWEVNKDLSEKIKYDGLEDWDTYDDIIKEVYERLRED